MKVLVPLNRIEHIDDFVDAGANEFYIGFYDKDWDKKFGDFNDINRMSGIKENANSLSFNEILELIKKVKSLGVSLYITFNSSIYAKEQLIFINEYFRMLKLWGCDGVIVSCKELCQMAKDISLPSVISTIAGVYNSDIARFYKNHGAKRIILPRDLSVDEIRNIKVLVPDVEYEVFMMRNGCVFSDSNCLGLHRKEICGICTSVKRIEHSFMIKDRSMKSFEKMNENNQVYSKSFHQYSCGLCSIYDFIQMGISACKIVGRYDEYQYVLEDVRLVHKNIQIASLCKSRDEYLRSMQLPIDSEIMCNLGLSCYYPEIRFN